MSNLSKSRQTLDAADVGVFWETISDGREAPTLHLGELRLRLTPEALEKLVDRLAELVDR